MKKLLIFLFLIIHFQFCSAQIIWNSEKQINWCDFKGLPNKETSFSANTSTTIEYSYHLLDSCLVFFVQSVFNSQESWFLDSSKVLLEHERGHFMITEIYARKIRKYLSCVDFKVVGENEIDNMIDIFLDAKDKFHNIYDIETNFSLNIIDQEEWQKKY